MAAALLLTDVEREHSYLLELGRTPEVRSRQPEGDGSAVLDALDASPALIRMLTAAGAG